MPTITLGEDDFESPSAAPNVVTLTDNDFEMAKPKKKASVKKPAKVPVYLGEWQQDIGQMDDDRAEAARQVSEIQKRGGAFQGGLATGAQTKTPQLVS